MKKLGLRRKMMSAILIVAVLCTLTVSLFSYQKSRQWMEQNYVEYVDSQASMQIAKFDETMHNMYLSITNIGCSEALTDSIAEYLASEQTFEDSVKVSNTLKGLLTMQIYDSTLYLYIPKTEEMFSTRDYYTRQKLDRSNTLIWKRKQDKAFCPLFYMNYFTGSAEYVFGYACSVEDENRGIEAVLCLAINERQLYYDLLAPLNNNSNGENYLLLSPKGLVCSSAHTAQLGCMLDGWKQITGERMLAQTTKDDQLNLSVQAPFTGYYILCQSDLRNLTSDLKKSRTLEQGILLLIFIILVIIATNLSGQMYQPIGALVDAIEKVRSGDFSARVSEKRMDEDLVVVARGFNDMMAHIDELMEHIIQERTEKREAEINALQYQIRPHFMYNTLNSIRFAALLQRNQKLADLLSDFIELLEASIQRKGAFITMKEEIELVQRFLALQSFRYFDCFETVFHVEPEAEGCYVPCLLLQPMVENAVFHGIDPKRNDNLLEIDVWIEGERLRISIIDNGAGFETEQSTEGNNEKRRLTGIGMNNVKERLKLYYGDMAYFLVFTQPGKGTTVEFNLPISYDPDEYSIKKGGDKK